MASDVLLFFAKSASHGKDSVLTKSVSYLNREAAAKSRAAELSPNWRMSGADGIRCTFLQNQQVTVKTASSRNQ